MFELVELLKMLICEKYLRNCKTSLCIGDSYINRLKTMLENASSSAVYNVEYLCGVHYFGINGVRVSKQKHISCITFVIHRIL